MVNISWNFKKARKNIEKQLRVSWNSLASILFYGFWIVEGCYNLLLPLFNWWEIYKQQIVDKSIKMVSTVILAKK